MQTGVNKTPEGRQLNSEGRRNLYPVPNYNNNKYGDKKMVRRKAHVTLSRDMKNATTVLVWQS